MSLFRLIPIRFITGQRIHFPFGITGAFVSSFDKGALVCDNINGFQKTICSKAKRPRRFACIERGVLILELCDPSVVKALLSRHGFHFHKTLGQNFLIDPSVPQKIAESCGASKAVGAFEVGPGIGALTLPLAQHAARVLALELDRALLPILDETLAEADNVTVVQGDVLKSDLSALKERYLGPGPAVACANLPYYITTPAVTALIEAGCFSDLTVMVQREVALRFAGEAGSRDYGAFSVYIQTHARPEILFSVPADCFIPRPKVDSAVIRLHLLSEPPFPIADPALYHKVVRSAFSQRRKTLQNALSQAFPGQVDKKALADAIESCGFPSDIRGERLSPADFSRLSAEIGRILSSRNSTRRVTD